MEGKEIYNFLKKNCPEIPLENVVYVDQISKIGNLKKPEFVIFNQSLSGTKGSHWLTLDRDFDGNYSVFDPLISFLLLYSLS